jgi:hypothetical protein
MNTQALYQEWKKAQALSGTPSVRNVMDANFRRADAQGVHTRFAEPTDPDESWMPIANDSSHPEGDLGLLHACVQQCEKVQLWRFPVNPTSATNYEYEISRHNQGEQMIWSMPDAYNNYEDSINVCLVTSPTHVDMHVINDGGSTSRPHWTSQPHTNTIDMKLIGRWEIPSKSVATLCEYKQWWFGGKFQPIKRVTFKGFIDNMKEHCNAHQ